MSRWQYTTCSAKRSHA